MAQNFIFAVETNLTGVGSIQERLGDAWVDRITQCFPLGATVPPHLASRIDALHARMTTLGGLRVSAAALSDDEAQDVVTEMREIRDELEELTRPGGRP